MNTAVHFVEAFGLAQQSAYEINTANGWWADRNLLMESSPKNLKECAQASVIISLLGLVTSEVAEAMEAVRKHPPETWADASKKDTLVRELAGTVIRCMDMAERFKLPLGDAIIEELKANRERGYKHGGKKA